MHPFYCWWTSRLSSVWDYHKQARCNSSWVSPLVSSTYISVGHMNNIAGQMMKKLCQAIFQISCIILHPNYQGRRVLIKIGTVRLCSFNHSDGCAVPSYFDVGLHFWLLMRLKHVFICLGQFEHFCEILFQVFCPFSHFIVFLFLFG